MMKSIIWRLLPAGSTLLGACLLFSANAFAAESETFSGNETQSKDTAAQAVNAASSPLGTDAAPPATDLTADSISEANFTEKNSLLLAGSPADDFSQLDPLETSETELAQPSLGYPAAADLASGDAIAPEGLATISDLDAEAMEQVTSVSQLSDVQPTDWAFQALQSLVERYGCIAGYPDGTYKGRRALSRYEFAAGLNACLDRISELIAAATADLATKEDLATLQKLQDEFAAELATLRGRVDSLEARTAELEANQFSTTTKLVGEVVFAISDTFGDEAGGTEDDTNTVFTDRVRLNLDTSFTGRDKLRVRLQARNNEPFDGGLTGTRMTRLGFDGNNGNDVGLDDVFYEFPVGEKLDVLIAANSVEPRDFFDVVSPLKSSGSGSVSRFGRLNPVLRLPDSGEGAALNYKLSKQFELGALYFAGVGNDPTDGRGLFNGEYGAMAHLLWKPSNKVKVGLSYINYFAPGGTRDTPNLTGSTGSSNAVTPFGDSSTQSHSVGLSTAFTLGKKFTIAPWAGVTFADEEAGSDSATIWNWAVQFALKDAGKKGNVLGFVVGMPPKVTDNDISAREDDDTSLHFELLYKYKVNDYIAITPGVFVITNPEHDADNDTQVVGVIRTVFKF